MSTEDHLHAVPTDGTPPPVGSIQPERKVAIVGFTSSRDEAPWDDPSWEKWICNNLWKFVPEGKWDRLYDLHRNAEIAKDTEHLGYLARCPKPLYVHEPQPEWPTAVRFPREELMAVLGGYFTNSISWMIAHALSEGVTHLSIFGVDLAQGTEYASQRPSAEYFLGIAVGMGVQVYVPETSDLLKTGTLYGVDDDSWMHARLAQREAELVAQMGQVHEQTNQGHLRLAQLQGALEATRYWKGVALSPRGTRDETAAAT